jgi:hypothetical protein
MAQTKKRDNDQKHEFFILLSRYLHGPIITFCSTVMPLKEAFELTHSCSLSVTSLPLVLIVRFQFKHLRSRLFWLEIDLLCCLDIKLADTKHANYVP